MIAHIGVPWIAGGDQDDTCPEGAPGCASINIRREKEIHKGRIRIHKKGGQDDAKFGQLAKSEQDRIKAVMLHESIHALTWMQHRPGPGSIMEQELTPGRRLSPMDEALLRLYGNHLILPGMDLSEIQRLIVFSDELLDSDPDIRMEGWNLVKSAHDRLRQAAAAEFTVRGTSSGCLPDFGWSNYILGNLSRTTGGFSWVRLDDGASVYYTIALDYTTAEHWGGSSNRWLRLTPTDYSERTLGWRNDAADPYMILEMTLYHANWEEISLNDGPDGLQTIVVPLRIDPSSLNASPAASEILMVIDKDSRALVEYEVEWKLSNQECGVFRVQAKNGKLDTAFPFPRTIVSGSDILAICDVNLGLISNTIRMGELWQRHCVPPARTGRLDAFSRTYEFLVDQSAVVRAELESEVNASLYLSTGDSVLEEGAGNASWDAWVQRRLPPGSYSIDVVSQRSVWPDSFELSITATPTGDAPHTFKSVSAGSRHSCGLLYDGTTVCWGWNRHGQAAPPPGEKFESITSGTGSCGLRKDGSAVCWGADSAGQSTPPEGESLKAIDAGFGYSCGLRHDGSAVCWGRNENGKATPPGQERFKSISCGATHSCGLRLDGTAVCWGSNRDGQAKPPEGEVFVSISSGEEHTCGLRQDGTPVCWGSGRLRSCQVLPDGSTACSIVLGDGPPIPPTEARFVSLSTGSPTCGLKFDGSALCWGRGERGQLSVPEGRRFVSLSASGVHTCGILEDGSAICWGWDQMGQASPPP